MGKRTRFASENGRRGVVTHRPDRFLAFEPHRLEDELQLLVGESKRLLLLVQGELFDDRRRMFRRFFGRGRAILGPAIPQMNHARLEPIAIWLAADVAAL